MAKKGSGKTYTSQGKYPTLSAANRRLGRSGRSEMTRLKNQQKAWQEGKPVSRKTLLTYGPRNTAENALHARLRKATHGIKSEMDFNKALKAA